MPARGVNVRLAVDTRTLIGMGAVVVALAMALALPGAAYSADAYEPNDTMSEATVLTSAMPQLHRTEGNPTTDWFAVDVVAGRGYDIRFEFDWSYIPGMSDVSYFGEDGAPLDGVLRDPFWVGFLGQGCRHTYLAEKSQRIYIYNEQHRLASIDYRVTLLEREPNTFSGTVSVLPTAAVEGWTVRLRESVDGDTMIPGAVLDTSSVSADGAYRLETMKDDVDVTVEFVSPDQTRWPTWLWGEPLFVVFDRCHFQHLDRAVTTTRVDHVGVEYGRVEGTVASGAVPFPGATVELQVPWGFGWRNLQTAVSSDTGEFFFGHVDPREHLRVFVTDPSGKYLDPTGQHPVTVPPGGTAAVESDLQLGGAIEGTLTDRVTGGPIAGASVELCVIGLPYPDSVMRSMQTDEDGRYAADGLSQGAYHLFARYGSYQSSWYIAAGKPEAQSPVSISWADSTTVNMTLHPDGQAPVTSMAVHAGTDGRPYISLSATDVGGSGVAATYYTMGRPDPIRYTEPFVVEPWSDVFFHSVDALGNVETSTWFYYAGLPSTVCSLSAPSSFRYGKSAVLTATLSRTDDGAVMPQEGVVFEQRTAGAWQRIGASATDAFGRATVSVAPLTRTVYRARYAGAGDPEVEASAPRSLAPRPDVGDVVVPAPVVFSKTVRVWGWLRPQHAASTHPLRVYRYRLEDGRWNPHGYSITTVTDWAGRSRYSSSLRLDAGVWRLRAFAPADAEHASAWAPRFTYLAVK